MRKDRVAVCVVAIALLRAAPAWAQESDGTLTSVTSGFRLSFNVDQNNRDTRVLEHQYERFLIGTSLVYGF